MNASRRLCLEGEVHVCGVLSLQRAITTALDDGHRQVVVDLGALTLLSAPAMRLFCGTLRGLRLRRRAAHLTIINAPPLISRIVEVCRIDHVAVAAKPAAAQRSSAQ